MNQQRDVNFYSNNDNDDGDDKVESYRSKLRKSSESAETTWRLHSKTASLFGTESLRLENMAWRIMFKQKKGESIDNSAVADTASMTQYAQKRSAVTGSVQTQPHRAGDDKDGGEQTTILSSKKSIDAEDQTVDTTRSRLSRNRKSKSPDRGRLQQELSQQRGDVEHSASPAQSQQTSGRHQELCQATTEFSHDNPATYAMLSNQTALHCLTPQISNSAVAQVSIQQSQLQKMLKGSDTKVLDSILQTIGIDDQDFALLDQVENQMHHSLYSTVTGSSAQLQTSLPLPQQIPQQSQQSLIDQQLRNLWQMQNQQQQQRLQSQQLNALYQMQLERQISLANIGAGTEKMTQSLPQSLSIVDPLQSSGQQSLQGDSLLQSQFIKTRPLSLMCYSCKVISSCLWHKSFTTPVIILCNDCVQMFSRQNASPQQSSAVLPNPQRKVESRNTQQSPKTSVKPSFAKLSTYTQFDQLQLRNSSQSDNKKSKTIKKEFESDFGQAEEDQGEQTVADIDDDDVSSRVSSDEEEEEEQAPAALSYNDQDYTVIHQSVNPNHLVSRVKNQSSRVRSLSAMTKMSYATERPQISTSSRGSSSGSSNVINNSSNNDMCHNCQTQVTPLWRKGPQGENWCNACGLYYKLHNVIRPISMKSSVIKKRVRSSSSTSAQMSAQQQKDVSASGLHRQHSAHNQQQYPQQDSSASIPSGVDNNNSNINNNNQKYKKKREKTVGFMPILDE
ncbi:hypothetical protein MP228_012259 [Amoeboaphelidium protococcarum]|nr:hypothetical protein MP228_012259 [Amoeboaphelidium protococcarum]